MHLLRLVILSMHNISSIQEKEVKEKRAVKKVVGGSNSREKIVEKETVPKGWKDDGERRNCVAYIVVY